MIIKINLLPKEIIERRKAERIVPMAIFGIFTLVCVLGSLYAFNAWKISLAEQQVSLVGDQIQLMNRSMQSLVVYEQRIQDVQRKRSIAEKTLTGRILWSRLLEDLMVKTPPDVTLTSLSGNADGITLSGMTLNQADKRYSGHKPVARWLVKLSELESKPKIWLGSSNKKGNTVIFNNTIKFKKAPEPVVPPSSAGK